MAEPAEAVEDTAPVKAAAIPDPHPRIDFKNAHAVRAAFLTALLIWLLVNIPLGGAAGILLKLGVLVAGGFLAVVLYCRRTGEMLSVASGARLGWITGVVFYAIWILFFTVAILAVQQQGSLMELWQKQLEESNAPAATIQQINEFVRSPEVFGVMIIIMLGVFFLLFTLPMIVGGAVAAKMLDRESTSA